MNHSISDKIRDRYESEYTIHEYEHNIQLWLGGPCPYYVELQNGGDMTLVVVRQRTSGPRQNPLVGMPYTCGPDDADVFDRIDRALDTVEYHNQ